MAPAAVILKQRNGLSIYANTPATDKFISIESLASLLRSTVTILRPRIVAAPNSPITTLTITPAVGAPVDVEFISESKLPGLLSFVVKAPTAVGLSLVTTQLLQSLAKYQFSLISFTENFTGTVVGTVQGSGGTTTGGTPGGGNGGEIQVKVLNNIFTDLALEPISSGAVNCKQYWPGSTNTGTGGLFMGRPVTGYVVDSVKVFAAADGVWVRVSDDNYLSHAGAIGKKNNNTFPTYQYPLRNYLPNVLLSDKFATLAAARAWYPFANILSLAESLNSAALQHLACLGEVNIEDASYWFNRAFEYFSGVVIKGKGSNKTILVFDADNAFRPRFESTTNPGFAEIYKQNMYFGGMSCYGTVPVNASGQLLTTETTPFVEGNSGFYLPRKAPAPNVADAISTNPQMLFTSFEDLVLERFAGHGISLGNVFNAQLEKVRGENNKGFAVHTFTSNSVKYSECYVGKFNAKGGFWLENGGKLDNPNGIDCFDQRPGVVFGAPGSTQRVFAEVNGGNIEGTSRLIDLHGNGSSLKIVNTFLQYHHTDSNYPPIRVHGFNCKIDIDVSVVGASTSSTIATTKPQNFMWVRGNGNGHSIIVRNMPPFSGTDYFTYMVVNAAGTDLYGGNGEILYLKPDEARVSLLDYGVAGDIYAKTSQFPKLYVKNQAIGTVDTTAALPTITANPGLYINVNAAATAANKIFIKIGDTNTGWSAL